MKKFYWILGLLLILTFSYCREVIFLSINELLNQQPISEFNILEPLLNNWNSESLVHLKYVLTLLFTLLFTGLTLLFLSIGFQSALAFQSAKFIYIIIFIVMLLIGVLGYFIFGFKEVYPLLRFFIEYLHGPFLFLIFSTIPVVKEQLKKTHFN